MSVEIVVHESREALAAALAASVAADARAAIASRGRTLLAAPGGGTPRPFLERLAEEALEWPRVGVVATDERWTPLDDPRSNASMIQAALGGKGVFTPFYADGETPEEAAERLSGAFAAARFDQVVMGMGADMHCASLFPGAPELAAAMGEAGPLFSRMTPGDGLEPRVTLTARALVSAGVIRLLITGEEKRAALDAALAEDDPLLAPVGAVLRRARRAEAHWAA